MHWITRNAKVDGTISCNDKVSEWTQLRLSLAGGQLGDGQILINLWHFFFFLFFDWIRFIWTPEILENRWESFTCRISIENGGANFDFRKKNKRPTTCPTGARPLGLNFFLVFFTFEVLILRSPLPIFVCASPSSVCMHPLCVFASLLCVYMCILSVDTTTTMRLLFVYASSLCVCVRTLYVYASPLCMFVRLLCMCASFLSVCVLSVCMHPLLRSSL